MLRMLQRTVDTVLLGVPTTYGFVEKFDYALVSGDVFVGGARLWMD